MHSGLPWPQPPQVERMNQSHGLGSFGALALSGPIALLVQRILLVANVWVHFLHASIVSPTLPQPPYSELRLYEKFWPTGCEQKRCVSLLGQSI